MTGKEVGREQGTELRDYFKSLNHFRLLPGANMNTFSNVLGSEYGAMSPGKAAFSMRIPYASWRLSRLYGPRASD